jgi:subtilisin family serine protease
VNWNAKILAMRVTDPSGLWNQTDLSEAVIYAADHGADVLSMSLQSYTTSPLQALIDALAYAYDGGTLPVAAAGNSAAGGTIAYPAKFPKCLAVGSTNNQDVRSSFSNTGVELDIVAPGEVIYSTWSITGNPAVLYNTDSGTSMATPHVAGLAGLIHSRNPSLTSAQIETIIDSSVDDKGPAGWDSQYGWGRINLRTALVQAAPPCPGDANSSPPVDVNDLLAVVTHWGACVSPVIGCTGDISPTGAHPGDGQVNVNDLLLVITHWGACP